MAPKEGEPHKVTAVITSSSSSKTLLFPKSIILSFSDGEALDETPMSDMKKMIRDQLQVGKECDIIIKLQGTEIQDDWLAEDVGIIYDTEIMLEISSTTKDDEEEEVEEEEVIVAAVSYSLIEPDDDDQQAPEPEPEQILETISAEPEPEPEAEPEPEPEPTTQFPIPPPPPQPITLLSYEDSKKSSHTPPTPTFNIHSKNPSLRHCKLLRRLTIYKHYTKTFLKLSRKSQTKWTKSQVSLFGSSIITELKSAEEFENTSFCQALSRHFGSSERACVVVSFEELINVLATWEKDAKSQKVSERSERAFWKTRILARKCAKWFFYRRLHPILSKPIQCVFYLALSLLLVLR